MVEPNPNLEKFLPALLGIIGRVASATGKAGARTGGGEEEEEKSMKKQHPTPTYTEQDQLTRANFGGWRGNEPKGSTDSPTTTTPSKRMAQDSSRKERNVGPYELSIQNALQKLMKGSGYVDPPRSVDNRSRAEKQADVKERAEREQAILDRKPGGKGNINHSGITNHVHSLIREGKNPQAEMRNNPEAFARGAGIHNDINPGKLLNSVRNAVPDPVTAPVNVPVVVTATDPPKVPVKLCE